jgi:hypothetical protein
LQVGFGFCITTLRTWTSTVYINGLELITNADISHTGNDYNAGAGFEPGYYRMTLDIPNNTLTFTKID